MSRDCCDHCTLPLGGRIVTSEVDGAACRFCCYGCLLAFQVTRAAGDEGQASAIVIRLGLAIFLAMNVMVMSLPGYAPYLYGGDGAVFEGPLNHVLRWLAMSFALPVLALLGWPILRSFVAGGWSGGAVADGLVLLGAVSAFALSVYHTIVGSAAVYFDTAVMVLLFVTLGRYLEARARADAGRAIRADLLAAPATALRVEGGDLARVAVGDLLPGDVVRVVAGEMFPTDGVVVTGEGAVDEALMTGESRLVPRWFGSAVAGGTCSVDGCFDVRVVRPAADSAAARIERMLDEARRSLSPMERMADRFARLFLPATVAVAVVAGLWHGIGDVDAGVLTALSVLVVACPCALGIATPVALWFGVASAARRGIILRDAGVLERASRIDRVFLDKTGTLTERIPRLDDCSVAPDSPWSAAEILRYAGALESGQHHPIARAIVAAASDVRGTGELRPLEVSDVRVLPGRGICGLVAGVSLEISASLAGCLTDRGEEHDGAGRAAASGGLATDGSEVVVRADGRLRAVLRFSEGVRADALASVTELRDELGVAVGVLSGDSSAPALRRLAALDVEIATGLLPDDKLRRVAEAAARAKQAGGAVGFVGDGVNDAPALAAADVGVAFGEPADLPRVTADALCLTDRLGAIPWLLRHARRSMRIVRQNLAMAFGYNSIAVALAAAGRLDPLVAALAMLGSSILVVANARRVARRRETEVGSREPTPAAHGTAVATADQRSWMPSSSSLR